MITNKFLFLLSVIIFSSSCLAMELKTAGSCMFLINELTQNNHQKVESLTLYKDGKEVASGMLFLPICKVGCMQHFVQDYRNSLQEQFDSQSGSRSKRYPILGSVRCPFCSDKKDLEVCPKLNCAPIFFAKIMGYLKDLEYSNVIVRAGLYDEPKCWRQIFCQLMAKDKVAWHRTKFDDERASCLRIIIE